MPQAKASKADTEENRIHRAMGLIEQGELSHAARTLKSLGLAPGNQTTLEELRDPQLRPEVPAEDLPGELGPFRPMHHIILDMNLLGTVLRQARKGLNCGMFGSRYEYFKLCLEDDVAFNALGRIAQQLARAQVPETTCGAMRVSSLTGLLKPNSRVRGISSGDTFRRLVAKTMAKQYAEELEVAVWLANFGMSSRSGTDSAIHMLQFLTDTDPNKIVLSIDGVGAFDHICRARMFEQLLAHPSLQALVPFVRQWYATPSQFR